MRRRGTGGDIRAKYLAELERLENHYGGPTLGEPFAAQITALKAGKPVIVGNGYEIETFYRPIRDRSASNPTARSRRLSLSITTRTPLGARWWAIGAQTGRW